MGLFSIFKSNKRLYFPGCSAYFKHKDIFELYEKVLLRLGIDFKLPEKKICCGLVAFELGYETEARKIARRNFEIFKEANISEIITSDPGCYKFFLKDYPVLIPDWDIRVENLWKLVLERLEEKPGLIKSRGEGKVVFCDSCYLGRYCGVYQEPRKILNLIGYEIVELYDSFEKSTCCGSCGGLNFTNPSLSDDIAKDKILQVKRSGVKRLIVSSVSEYELIKKNIVNDEIEVMELSEILSLALGIKKREEEILKKESFENNFEEQSDKEIIPVSQNTASSLTDIENASDDEIDSIVENALKQPKAEIIGKIAEDFRKNSPGDKK